MLRNSFECFFMNVLPVILDANAMTYWPLTMDYDKPVCCKDAPFLSVKLNGQNITDLDSNFQRFTELECGLLCYSNNFHCSFYQVKLFDVGGSCSMFSDLPTQLYQGNLSSCKMYSNKRPCFTNISSWGHDDILGNFTDCFIEVIGSESILTVSRGINTVELDATNCSISKPRNFNFEANLFQYSIMKGYLDSLPMGTIVVGQSCDDPRKNLDSIQSYLASLGIDTYALKFRGKLAFVLRKGFPNKTISLVKNGVDPLSLQCSVTKSTLLSSVEIVRIY